MTVALVLSDVHDNIEAFKTLISSFSDYDLLIMCGDICEFNCSSFVKWFKIINVPTIIVHGNHDCLPCFQALSEKLNDFYLIDKEYVKLIINGEEIVIAGIGGVYSEKRSDMHHFNPSDIIDLANKLLRDNVKLDILITHECAKNCSDVIPYSRKRGGKTELYLLHLIGEPKIHICGHMHTPMIERRGNVLCINPGYGFIGLGALVDLSSSQAKIIQVNLTINLREEHKIIYTYNWIRNVKRSYFRILRNEAVKLRSLL